MNLKEKAKTFKLLSPAGDWASLRAGVQAGADSIYFGIKNFNMRSKGAKNFCLEDVSKVSKYCKEKNVETYLTVNTLLFDSDLNTMKRIIDEAKKSKIDGVIVSDFAAIEYAKEIDMPMCISTQMSVSNIDSVKFFSKYANRIILARELTLEQIKGIIKEIEKQNITGPNGKLVEIEVFGHGALCVAVSGRCNMSLYCYNKSADRGECTQVCRRAYKVTDLETNQELEIQNNYVMSPKDLCTIGMLDKIIDAGVKVLKVEGRGRTPEYVSIVTKTYKEAIQAIQNGEYTTELIENLNKKLETVFNRGFSQGMYMGRSQDEWTTGDGNQATEKRKLVGKVLHFFSEKEVALIKVHTKVELKQGQKCLIVGNKTGLVDFELKNMIINNQKVKIVKQGEEFTVKVPNTVRKNDDVFVIISSKN